MTVVLEDSGSFPSELWFVGTFQGPFTQGVVPSMFVSNNFSEGFPVRFSGRPEELHLQVRGHLRTKSEQPRKVCGSVVT